jgi:surface antigen-like variable number repeat protein
MRAVWLLILGSSSAAAALISQVHVLGALPSVELESRAGEALDTAKIQHDIKTLWRSGRIADVTAETQPDGDRVDLLFRVRARRFLELRKVQIEPLTPGVDAGMAPGAEIDAQGAQEAAARIRKQLEVSGFPRASVTSRLLAAGGGKADLRIHVDKGQAIDIVSVRFTGDSAVPESELRHALRATKSKTILPGWHWRRSFSEQAVMSDEANLRSFLFHRGFFEASVHSNTTLINPDKAGIEYAIDSGPRYDFPTQPACRQFFHQRRDAERIGVLDFSPRIEVARAAGTVTAARDLGPAYFIHRIQFRGSRSFSDSTLRRTFLLSESDPLDQTLLRRSIARLNATGFFEPLTPANVLLNTPPGTDRADVTVWLKEKKLRSWLLSGPVGPMSVAGPLQFAIGTRLPPWGQGIFELATYTLSANLMFFAKPIPALIPFLPHKRFLPLLTIQRPGLPGQALLSGITIAPQLGWRGMLLGYGASKLRNLTRGVSQSERAFQTPLPVIVLVDGQEKGTMNCEVEKTKLDWVRQIGGTAANLAWSFFPL